MSGALNILGGVGRGISRGAEDWRAWDEEKRKKQAFEWTRAQEEHNAKQRTRTEDQWNKESQYEEGVKNLPIEGDGKPVETPYQLPSNASFGPDDPINQVKGLKRVQQTASPAEVARQRGALAANIGLPGVAERQTDRAYKLEADAEASRQRKITSALSMAGATLTTNPEASLRSMEAVLEGTGATLIIENGKWGLAAPGQGPSAQPRMIIPMQDVNPATVAKAMEHAYGYLNSENFFKAQTLDVQRGELGVKEGLLGVARDRQKLDVREFDEIKVPLSKAQIGALNAEVDYRRSMAAAAGSKAEAEKWSTPQIISIPETGQSAFWQYDQTGKEKVPRITFLPRGFNAKGAVEAIKVDDFELPKGSGLTGGKMITYKDGEVRVIGVDQFGVVKDVARRGGMSGINVPKPDFAPGATNAPPVAPAPNVNASMDGPSQSVNAPGVGAVMPGPGPQIGGAPGQRGVPLMSDEEYRRLYGVPRLGANIRNFGASRVGEQELP